MVEFVSLPLPGRRTAKPKSPKAKKVERAKTIGRRRCTSRFDTGTSILECWLSPGHYDFHRPEKLNDGYWTDKQQMKGTG